MREQLPGVTRGDRAEPLRSAHSDRGTRCRSNRRLRGETRSDLWQQPLVELDQLADELAELTIYKVPQVNGG